MISLNSKASYCFAKCILKNRVGIQLLHVKCLSTVTSTFQPIISLTAPASQGKMKKDELQLAKSQKLLLEMGVIRQANPGMFTFLPLGLRALEKLKKIVEEEMGKVGCQKLSLPTLTSSHLWKTTGRWESTGSELLTLSDRHEREYVLSPTHEEAITDLVASITQLTYRQLPLKLYQITRKYRDEMKPRFGLLRGREFIMKDLYTFDESIEKAQDTYTLICSAYDAIFNRLSVPYVKVLGATGNIGGLSSHEYHFPCAIGEDILKLCSSCSFGTNTEVSANENCPKCGTEMRETKGIEVGHTFLLGDKYSKALNANYIANDGSRNVCQMGCYGIGVSRILAASVEVLSSENEIRWPNSIAPYSVCVIGPKAGSKEESSSSLIHFVAQQIDGMEHFEKDVIFDDRDTLTIGKRLMEAKRMGYPYILIAGKKSIEPVPKLEFHDLCRNLRIDLNVADVFQYLKDSRKSLV